MNIRFSPPVQGVVAGVKSLFGSGHNRTNDKEDRIIVDVDEEGNQLYKEDIIAQIMEELERRRSERLPLEQQWILNSNFLIGNQYCDINPIRREIEQLEPVYDWLERETFNQIAPLIQTRIANLKKITYMMKVKPRTNELEDYAKAETSTSILQYIQKNSGFEQKKDTMIAWNELCGSCFWLSWWDASKGEFLGTLPTVEESDRGEQKVGTTPVYQGELDYGLITPYEVYPESIFKQSIEAQRSIILEQVKTVDEIYDLYGIEVKGTQVETFALTPVGTGGGFGQDSTVMSLGHRSIDNAQKVITYFEKPSRRHPKGKMIIVVGNEELVYYGELPYNKIPLIQCICHEIPGQFFGKSVIEDLIPLQRDYNGCINRIHEYIKRIAIQSMIVEEGSIVDIEEFEENGHSPGAVLRYRQGYNPPVPLPNGQLPSEIMQERYNLKSDMEYIAGTSQLMVNGAVPSGVTSGTAIENLMEIDNTRLSLTGDYIRNSIQQLSVLWLEIYKKYATTKRVVNYVGKNNIGPALVWSNNDINSYDVEYVTENELLLSEEMQKQRFFDAYNMGLFTDDNGRIPERVKQRALEYMKIGNYSEIMNINTLQIQAAQREHTFFESGIVPQISDVDEHEIHYEEHLRYVLQMDFQILKMKKPDYAELLLNHLKQHKSMIEQEKMSQLKQVMMNQGGL